MKYMLETCLSDNWERCGVVLEPCKDLGEIYIQNFTSPAEFLGDGRWRLWYSAITSDGHTIAQAIGVPGKKMERQHVILSDDEPVAGRFSIGNLPSNWRPTQVIHINLSGGRHRLYFWAHGPGVIRYLAAESEDGLAYHVLEPFKPVLCHPCDRMAVYSNEVRAMGLAPQQDPERIYEMVPEEHPAWPDIVCNDATNLYLLPDGTYELYSPGLVKILPGELGYVTHDNAAGLRRVIDRWTSADGLVWTNRKRVIEPDEQDPADMQFYHLAVTHTPYGRIGMLGHYRVEAQTMDIECCFSNDGLTWRRPKRYAWLPRGGTGEVDCYGIYPPAGMIEHDGQWWLFYSGVNYTHNYLKSDGPRRTAVMLAKANVLQS